MQAILSLRDWLFPIPHLDEHAYNTFTRVIHDLEPRLLNTPRRKDAWYLSTLAIRPELQSKGLGTMLLRHGLQRADRCGAAAWLVGLKAVEGYYERHGFVEVARANVGEMKDWEGGAVMFRNE
jgi:predicted N-acetyltransferase YhbS